MSSYARPGVFVNQSLTPLVSSATGSSSGSVACFVGAYNRGPTKPTYVTSWQGFVNLYGSFSVANGAPLVYAVWSFFQNGGSACYVYRVPNTDATIADLVIGSVETTQAALTAPAAPAVAASGTGGTVTAGVYTVEVTYTDTYGETTASASTQVTVTSGEDIVITSPAAQTNATGWYAYVSQAAGSTLYRQQTLGSPTTIGTNLTLTANPTTSGAQPPATNTTASNIPQNPTLLTLIAKSPGVYANSLYAEIVAGASAPGDTTSLFTLNIYQGGTTASNLVESWPGCSLNPASNRYLLSMLNASSGGSNYLTAKVSFTNGIYVAGDGSSDPAVTSPTALASGSDGTTAPALDTAITTGITPTGNPANPWNSPGLSSLTGTVINVNIPASQSSAITASVLNNVITWAENAGNVFVVIDAPFGGVPTISSAALVASYSSYLSGATPVDASASAAVYGPWLSVQDPASAVPNATTWIAPGGAVLGQWSVNDTFFSVAQTPAGTQTTVNCVGLEAYFTATDLNNLESMQVNPIRVIPGSGTCIFGGRTLSTGYPNRYVNISRTLLQFTTDFVNLTLFAAFQNNDAQLWQAITNKLTSYLMQAMQNGLLGGSTPETSFLVTCDDTTTSAAQALAGQVNAQVMVALVSPAEFIVINLSQTQGGATVTVSS